MEIFDRLFEANIRQREAEEEAMLAEEARLGERAAQAERNEEGLRDLHENTWSLVRSVRQDLIADEKATDSKVLAGADADRYTHRYDIRGIVKGRAVNAYWRNFLLRRSKDAWDTESTMGSPKPYDGTIYLGKGNYIYTARSWSDQERDLKVNVAEGTFRDGHELPQAVNYLRLLEAMASLVAKHAVEYPENR